MPPAQPPTLPPIGPPTTAAAAPSSGLQPDVSFRPELTFESTEPSPSSTRRSRGAVVGIAAGVVALGAAGVFAVSEFTGGNTGGAATPEEVGTELMTAIEAEDVLGMVDLLLPGERETFREPMIDLVSELTRLEVLSADASLSDLSGLDFELADEAVTVEPTNVADISNITMTASLTASLDGAQLPIGDFITDLAGDDFDPSELDEAPTTEDFDLSMAVVEDDGRWYLSVFHTAAEELRADSGGEQIPAAGLEPRGGATPEGAIDALLDGVEQLDVGKVIASINPNEAAALQRYAPLFLGDVDGLAAESGLDWQVTNTSYTVEGDGSKRFVTIDELRIDGTFDDGFESTTFTAEIKGDCLVIDAAGERVDTCELAEQNSGDLTSLEDIFGSSSDTTELVASFEDAFADYDPRGITVNEVDGVWYVSPIGTGFDQLLGFLGALDRAELDRIVDAVETFVDEFSLDDFIGVQDDVGPTDDFIYDNEGEADAEFEDMVYDACLALGDVDGIIECLTGAVARGELPEYYLGIELRYPECGLAPSALQIEPAWDLSDAAYTELMESAASCFEDAIARGEIDEFEVPAEYLRPDCAEGLNPWASSDEEFFDRWLDCIYS